MRAKKGTAAMKLDADDQLIGVYLSMNDEDKIFIASNSGNYNFYEINEISTTGRLTKGVKAIKLTSDESIRAATLVKKDIEYQG
jgi:DNA gyrase/topoisomerase IV subunit A